MAKRINIAIANHSHAIGKYLPESIVDNLVIETIFDHHEVRTSRGERLTAAWMAEHVGLNHRHWARPGELSSDMGIIAARQALGRSNISPYQLWVIRAGSSSFDCLYPALSCLIQNGLIQEGQPSLHLNACDMSGACTSGLHALTSVAEAMLCHRDYQYGLAVASDTMSKVVDHSDPNLQVWGDGAAAIVLEKTTEDRGIICTNFKSIPEAHDKTESIGLGVRYLRKNITPNAWFIGPDVQKFVIGAIIDIIPETIGQANIILRSQRKRQIRLEDIKMFGIHQANARIFERPAKKLGIPPEKFYINFPEYANTSSASVLLCLVDMIEQGLVEAGDLVMLITFGGGLLYGAMLLRI